MKKTCERKKKKREKWLLKTFMSGNSNMNMLISCVCVIMVWRAIWDMCETFILPNHQVLSDVLCLIIWIIVLLLDDGKLKELA